VVPAAMVTRGAPIDKDCLAALLTADDDVLPVDNCETRGSIASPGTIAVPQYTVQLSPNES